MTSNTPGKFLDNVRLVVLTVAGRAPRPLPPALHTFLLPRPPRRTEEDHFLTTTPATRVQLHSDGSVTFTNPDGTTSTARWDEGA